MQSHLTLFAFNCDDERGTRDGKLEQVSEAVGQAVRDWSSTAYEEPYVWFDLDKVGHFGHRVVFAEPSFRGGAYESLWRALGDALLRLGVAVDNVAFDKHRPHLTICKMSKVKRGTGGEPNLGKKLSGFS